MVFTFQPPLLAGLSGYVAELGAAFVSGAIGIKLHDREDHAAYLASWLQALRNDKRCIFTAATQAQAAADWLLSRMSNAAMSVAT